MKFFVDGNTSERVNNYCVWRVIDNEGNILSNFHGPMSRLAALAFCKMLNEDNTSSISITFSGYDNSKHGGITVKEL